MKFKLVILLCLIFYATGFTNAYSLTLYECILKENDPATDAGNPSGTGGVTENAGISEIQSFIDSLPSCENKDFFESLDDLSICRNEAVRIYIYQYLTQARTFLINAVIRSDRYLEIIEEVFENYPEIPKAISLLPLLESGFNPYAVSRSRAVGMWQILGSTSRDLGLKVNSWVDERRDIEKSTHAAVRHMKNLNLTFQSWELSLTAYNGGAAYVKKAMVKSGSNTFWELLDSKSLNKETGEFALRFAALAVIFRNQDLFSLDKELPEYNEIETRNFTLKYPVSITDIARTAEISAEVIRKYNPELKKNITPPYEKNYTIRVPASSVDKISEHIDKLYRLKFSDIRRHVVKEGECLSKIAALYHIKMQDIIELNNIKNPHMIKPGLELYIPI